MRNYTLIGKKKIFDTYILYIKSPEDINHRLVSDINHKLSNLLTF